MTTVANLEQEAPVAETNPLRIMGQPIAMLTAMNVYYGTVTKVTKTQVTATVRDANGGEMVKRFVRGYSPDMMTEHGYSNASYSSGGADLVVADDTRLPRWSAERAVKRAEASLDAATRKALPWGASVEDRLARAKKVAESATRLVAALERLKEVKS